MVELSITLNTGETHTFLVKSLPRHWKSWIMRQMPYGTDFNGATFDHHYMRRSVMQEDRITRFSVEITLGNDAMQTSEDVARALRITADYIDGTGCFEHQSGGSIRDDNGNTVGNWNVS